MPNTYHPDLALLATALTGRSVMLPERSRRHTARLFHAAGEHGVAQLLGYRVREGSVHGLTEEDREGLYKGIRSHAAVYLLQEESTRKTLALLTAENIPTLLLKGTPIASLYYGATYLRNRCDIDLFIPSTDKQRAADVLKANGYQISGLNQRTYSSRQFSAVQQTNRSIGASFDMHWKLSNRILFHELLNFQGCWETRQSVPALGGNAYTLSPANLLLHACIHRIAHGRNTQRNRLIWLYDVHLMTTAFSSDDYAVFLRLALEKRVGALCRDALIMSQYYFNTTYPERYLAALARNHRREPTAGLIRASKPRWAIADLLALQTVGERLSFAGELLFPPCASEEHGLLPRVKSWTGHLMARVG